MIPLPAGCKALVQTDEYYCASCGLRWGVDDEELPAKQARLCGNDSFLERNPPVRPDLAKEQPKLPSLVSPDLPETVRFGQTQVMMFYTVLAFRQPLLGEYYLSNVGETRLSEELIRAHKAHGDTEMYNKCYIVRATHHAVRRIVWDKGAEV